MDGRGDKIYTDRKGRKKRIRQSEVLHRAMYPNAHGNGTKKTKKKKQSSLFLATRQQQPREFPNLTWTTCSNVKDSLRYLSMTQTPDS